MWPARDVWEKKPTLFIKGLAAFYALCLKAHAYRRPTIQQASCPVLSIGNCVVGGSGKTPITLMLIDYLRTWGFTPIVVTRGYGGKIKGPVQANPSQHTHKEVGEEALLLAEKAPTYVARTRSSIIGKIELPQKPIVLLDDGHQHRSLHKDLSFLVMNEQQGIGNGYLLPAGPLREPLQNSLNRAQGIFFICDEGEPPNLNTSLPIFKVRPVFSCPLSVGASVVAFSALGYPLRFLSTLRHLGLVVKDYHVFRDHHVYRPKDEKRLLQSAHASRSFLVTTRKDFIKLSPKMQKLAVVVEQTLHLEEPEIVRTFIRSHLC